MTPKLILVPNDFTEPATHALRYAGALAERFDAHLLVIHADPLTDVDNLAGKLEAHVRLNVAPGVRFDTAVVTGWPVETIVERAGNTGADLIVLGTHGRTGLRRLFFGSVTEAVVRLATVPVIAVNSFTTPPAIFRKILCPVSFTPTSREALRYAAALSEDSTLILYRGIEAHGLQNSIDELIALQEWATRELADRCDVRILPSRVPPEQLVEFATLEQIDLIALGVPKGRSFGDALAGTVAEQIVQQSDCPVLTVNEQTARRMAPNRNLEAADIRVG